ncbi:MAG TPA: hypothetical protein EYQ50_01745 [Verrucomicrobiales bacterium]|nr:hypothetical protein [Verrucomicrobiales bacterium]HIL68482.1 hypothetical protein [Verrucomicrobiota bacterium]
MAIHLKNIAKLDEEPVKLSGTILPEELEIDSPDPLIRGSQALEYDLTGEKLEDSLLVRGYLEIVFDATCSRCLKSFPLRICLPDWACYLPLTGDEKVAIECDSVDLTPYVREDVLLELPQHPSCGDKCKGVEFRPKSESSVLPGPLKEPGESDPSAWSKLDQFKLK